jgi:hypothetical protein
LSGKHLETSASDVGCAEAVDGAEAAAEDGVRRGAHVAVDGIQVAAAGSGLCAEEIRLWCSVKMKKIVTKKNIF